MATTTNYGWTTPDDTALVKDGASAIRTLGSSVDTTTKNLNPETTLGDISFRSSTSNVNTRLGIGSTGTVLTVAGGVPTWAAAPTGLTLVYSNTFSAAQTASFDNVFTSSYRDYRIVIVGTTCSATDANVFLRLRVSSVDAATAYKTLRTLNAGSSVTGDTDPVGTTYYCPFAISNASPTLASSVIDVFEPQVATPTKFKSQFLAVSSAPSLNGNMSQGYHSTATSYDGFSLIGESGTITGSVRIYGYKNS